MSSASDHAEEGAPGERGSWEGSDVTEVDIKWLRDSRRIPAKLICRIPKKGDIEPEVESGERVVFLDHFERGFGLPAGTFFWDFLDTFGLQPHHLPANAILQLSAYATFSEGYLGLWPSIESWAKYFQLKKQSVPNKKVVDKEMTACGAASISPRRLSEFPRIQGLDSCRKWQRSFFYVKNPGTEDLINLPEFTIGTPTAQLNWDYEPAPDAPEVLLIHQTMMSLQEKSWGQMTSCAP